MTNAGLEAVAKRGEKIYRDRYKARFEKTHQGKFVVIEVRGAKPFLADTPEEALRTAMEAEPKGQFYLVLVGEPAVFKVGYSRCGMPSGNRVSNGRRPVR